MAAWKIGSDFRSRPRRCSTLESLVSKCVTVTDRPRGLEMKGVYRYPLLSHGYAKCLGRSSFGVIEDSSIISAEANLSGGGNVYCLPTPFWCCSDRTWWYTYQCLVSETVSIQGVIKIFARNSSWSFNLAKRKQWGHFKNVVGSYLTFLKFHHSELCRAPFNTSRIFLVANCVAKCAGRLYVCNVLLFAN